MKTVAFMASIISLVFALAGVVVLSLPWASADSFEVSLGADGFGMRWLLIGCICLIGGVIGTIRNVQWYATTN